MFNFENLDVYHKARDFRTKLFALVSSKKSLDRWILDQLKRSAISVILNIAEGTGKTSKADKRNFFTIARASVYELVAISDILCDDRIISPEEKTGLYADLETISKMLLGLINSLK
ncbi:four helix bundle protein [candidate division WOR-1 bacterium RIFOXYB2_FULL_42_35]|uniref:Four helix bundle protein n=1 Tax=candidate division WOR-1 bacterium RIFOXYC2_FULL_41_25 TaxID=1802586 RepID=A0A1F4TJ10_UNCSA|nr:MAG: four helix bundle protein [candidate division WOR-1 bacterium RIFOXYA2_FULL_41_14]OGC21807.1 MAG: four helix bundle protein [candidate division WOR-1 bacterium RIFOXYB2_FULL_42_35]OGC32705.1 MAG: four helix bundle protein [candidate division WOR-1 bacterium RIFOXYC2_FULL_41_25]OGC42576.1 MAG: four helix bundle protein [candidate division WOR-1 bacterium RIFOXYD2_FULL_41_8]